MSNNTVSSMTNIDGTITPSSEARIPVLDRGFLYGDSVYEVFRTYRGIPLFMEAHFDRLENSAQLVQMTISQSREELTAEIRRTIRSTGATPDDNVYVRYQITRGEGPIDLHPDKNQQTRYVIIVTPLKSWNPKHYSVGMSMAIPSVRRNPTNALDPNIKGGNYLNNVIAVMQARKRGADESLILSAEGYVTEASNSNVWFVIDDEVVTPGTGNLRGLTKAAILEGCEKRGVKAYERQIHSDELGSATECFVTSATREVMPVYCLELADGRFLDFPRGGGDWTREIQKIYREDVETYLDTHASNSFFVD